MYDDKEVFLLSENTNKYEEAYKYSSNHKEMLERDTKCGCFHCLSIFSPKEIELWVEDKSGTAICPKCGIDAIIGESSNYPINKEFLQEMRKKYFY